jgi:hypothetical protein
MMSPVDSPPRARGSAAKSAARMATPRRKVRLFIVLAGLGALLCLGGGVLAFRRAASTQARQGTEGVVLAQRRAGELPQDMSAPVAVSRSSESNQPASPTSLPMPDPEAPASPRYVLRDSVPLRPQPGHLFVDTQPEALVRIDGELKGKTPLDLLVGPGHKRLQLDANGFRPIHEIFDADQGAIIRRALLPLPAPR